MLLLHSTSIKLYFVRFGLFQLNASAASRLVQLYSCPNCTLVQIVQLSNLFTCPKFTLVQILHLSKLYSCPNRTLVKIIYLSKLYTCQNCSLVQIVHLSKLFTCPNSPILHWFKFYTPPQLYSSYQLRLGTVLPF